MHSSPHPARAPRVSRMAAGLVGSEILRIAAEIRALVRQGQRICNLTVGDFDPAQFPIPQALRAGIVEAYEHGETNYPPSDGIPELREAVRRLYQRELGLAYELPSVLITAGARPILYAAFRAVVDPGDRVVYPVPSWNNNHYVHLTGGVGVPVRCSGETRFLPTRDSLAPALRGARLLTLNSPLNPTGTAIDPGELREIAEAVVEENRGREVRGERPLFLLYDQVYWMLCVGDTRHATPSALLPECAPYTIYVDGISKAFAATGVRVGWAVGPQDVIERMSAIVGHVGAWAPRAEQVATVAWLDDAPGIEAYRRTFLAGISARLHALHEGLGTLASQGLPVQSLPPMGGIYLTARIAPFGQRTPQGLLLRTNDEVRRYVLEAAGIGIVPFQAFGVPEDDGWFRLSVGAVRPEEIAAALPRLAAALRALR